jgi:Predicted protease
MQRDSVSLLLVLIFLLSSTSPLAYSSPLPTQYQTEPFVMRGFHEVGSLPGDSVVVATVYIPLRNLNLLYYYAEQTSNPSSPLYHKFLTKEQVKSLFYPTAQFQSVLSYLKHEGLKVLLTGADSVIVVQGTVTQMENALGLHYYLVSNGTSEYYQGVGVPKLGGVIVVSNNLTSIFFSHPSTLFTQRDVNLLRDSLSKPANQTFPIEAYPVVDLRVVYNASVLLERGIDGSNYTVGILDLAGDPYIAQQLAKFDQLYHLPAPPNFTVVPVGPYDPNLGITSGWAGEISLDVEAAHSMAPGANITLYIANLNLPLSSILAYIVSQDNVDVLSQSFSIPEELLPTFSGPLFYQCVVLSDQYYAMGSAEGITFLASSGDGGGSGYSAGPLGSVGYPSTSPFVTSLGGTTTYLTFPSLSYNVTAWSNYGFVPPGVNYGGSTGGVSQVEPKPYYQWSISSPSGFPNGRETPDISANADVYPGIYIVCPGNVTAISGGTSEASPLTAGLLTLVMQASHTRLGNLNPDLYRLYSSDYGRAFTPITFGYNIPWTAGEGYNLVTGLGQLNVGELPYLLNSTGMALSVIVNDSNVSVVVPGQSLTVKAKVTQGNSTVSEGKFYLLLEGINGNLTEVPMTYNQGTWYATLTIPQNASGVIFVNVYGEANGSMGYGFLEVFSGYFAQFISPPPYTVEWTGAGVPLVVNLTSPLGTLAPNTTEVTVKVLSYNITNDSYTLVNQTTLVYSPQVNAWVGTIPQDVPSGPVLLEVEGAFGYDAFFNGIGLNSLFILPQVVAEPGTVYPGQDVIIQGSLTSPSNLMPPTSMNLVTGSNVTAELLSPSKEVVSRTEVLLTFTPLGPQYVGYLPVPANATPGLYTVLLFADYDSYILNETIPGFYYGQIYVGDRASTPLKFSTTYALEGSTLYVYSNITSGGKQVKYGMFSATVYPTLLSNEYQAISVVTEIPLWYNNTLGLWVGNITLPSSLSTGNLTYLGNSYVALPFQVLVSGVGAYGSATNNSVSSSSRFYVEPFTLVRNDPSFNPVQTYDSAFENDTLYVNGTMFNDLFLGENVIRYSQVTITSSNVSGTLILQGSNVTLVDVYANDLVVENGSVTLVNSRVNSISLQSSVVHLIQSYYSRVSPSPPIIDIGLTSGENLTGNLTFPVTVLGSGITTVKVLLDGRLVTSFTGNGTHQVTINTNAYPDGDHQVEVEVAQSDGLNFTASVNVLFQNQLKSVAIGLTQLNTTVQTKGQGLSTSINEDLYVALLGVVLGLVGIVVGVASYRRK